jgi:hypothetical protein
MLHEQIKLEYEERLCLRKVLEMEGKDGGSSGAVLDPSESYRIQVAQFWSREF